MGSDLKGRIALSTYTAHRQVSIIFFFFFYRGIENCYYTTEWMLASIYNMIPFIELKIFFIVLLKQ